MALPAVPRFVSLGHFLVRLRTSVQTLSLLLLFDYLVSRVVLYHIYDAGLIPLDFSVQPTDFSLVAILIYILY